MPETCDSCSCGISDAENESQTDEIPAYMPFQKAVRSYALNHLDFEDEDDIFIDKVEICPEKVEVTYSEGL